MREPRLSYRFVLSRTLKTSLKAELFHLRRAGRSLCFFRKNPSFEPILQPDPAALRKLVANHPDSKWIVRAFLDFGGRSLNPQRFFNDTISDMQRTLKILEGQDLVIELHNEPNLSHEGLINSWRDGAEFATWWLRLLRLYRYAFPKHQFIFPGLSPGIDADGLRQDHVRFLETSRSAIEEADGLGVHIYWSTYYSMEKALGI